MFDQSEFKKDGTLVLSEAYIKNNIKNIDLSIILFQTAYHGTPYNFDKFSTIAIGTGEGSQSFGWGLYYKTTFHFREVIQQKEGKIDSYQIKIDDYTKSTMEENLKAIENGKFFLQQNNIVPNYIFNPENNEVYKGEAQMYLQNENLKNNENNTMYSPFHQAISNGLNIPPGMKPKATIIKYPEQNGIQVYDIVVPSRNFIKKQEKMLKEERKLIAQNKINESKFYQKYGYVPAYPQTLQEEKQPPLINKEQLKIDKPQISLENKIEGVIEHDMKMYWACSFAKVPFKPTVNYNESPYKEQLAAFVKSNPKKMEKIANETYENITTQIKKQKNSNQNTNTNENNQEKQNTNTASKGRTK